MLRHYYDELSTDFDDFNETVSFGKYLDAINGRVAAELAPRRTQRVLSIGAGSGRRELRIRTGGKLSATFDCVDTSPKMCALLEKAGLRSFCGALPQLTLPDNEYDACLFLNAFEVLTSYAERLQYLQLINKKLKKGGLLFLDAMDIDNGNDAWAGRVREQYEKHDLANFGYELGDCFCRRADQELIVFAHYSNRQEMQELFAASSFRVLKLNFFDEGTGLECGPGQGHMFFIAEKF